MLLLVVWSLLPALLAIDSREDGLTLDDMDLDRPEDGTGIELGVSARPPPSTLRLGVYWPPACPMLFDRRDDGLGIALSSAGGSDERVLAELMRVSRARIRLNMSAIIFMLLPGCTRAPGVVVYRGVRAGTRPPIDCRARRPEDDFSAIEVAAATSSVVTSFDRWRAWDEMEARLASIGARVLELADWAMGGSCVVLDGGE